MSIVTIVSIEHIRRTYKIDIEDTDDILLIKSLIENGNTLSAYVIESPEVISEDVVSITVD